MLKNQTSSFSTDSKATPQAMSSPLFEVRKLTLSTPTGENQIDNLSLVIYPSEVVALVSLSAGSKKILLDFFSGYIQSSSGQVILGGEDLSKSRSFFPTLGIAPREDGLLPELTVGETLRYAARLRMPKGIPSSTRSQQVQEVLENLDLGRIQENRIGLLSPEERRRVSIAIELLSSPSPSLLILDEPFEDLDPGAEARLMAMLHNLGSLGKSFLLLSSHSLEVLMLADKLGLLLPNGSLGWFGPPEEALNYFQSMLPPENKLPGLAPVYNLLGSGEENAAREWAERYQADPVYQKYLAPASKKDKVPVLLDDRPLVRGKEKKEKSPSAPAIPKPSALGQLTALTGRSFKLLLRDRWMVVLALVAPLILAWIDLILSSRRVYDIQTGDPSSVSLSLVLLVLLVMLTAGAVWIPAFIKERAFYRRERRARLGIIPYVLSKVWIVILIAIYQGLIWTGVHYLATGFVGGINALVEFWITFSLAALAGGMLGLIASSISRSEGFATLLLLVLILPQFFLGGLLLPLRLQNTAEITLTSAIPARNAVNALISTSGYGRAVANDLCWQQPTTTRENLTEAQKENFCKCLGPNLFKNCAFPGALRFYTSQIDQPPPANPLPQENFVFPDKPLLRPGESVEQFNNDVRAYVSQIETVLGNINIKLNQSQDYMAKLMDWENLRSLAVGKTERLIAADFDRFGSAYNLYLPLPWLALLASSLVFVFILLGIQKGKDRG